MVAVPAGFAELRDDRRRLRWGVEIKPFQLGRYPLTNGQYRAVTGAEVDQPDDLPVTDLSWFDAIEVCNQLSAQAGLGQVYSRDASTGEVQCDWSADGYRLPTEAEWQYACKAGTKGYRYGELDDIAWYADNSDGRAHSVGGKAPNPWGLHDMLGNIWEWCWDLYDEETYGEYRIFRGGGWAESARGCGSTVRRRSHPIFTIEDLGLRLARSVH